MKKNYIFLLAIFIAMLVPIASVAQIKVLDEGFDTTPAGSLPSEWTQDPAVGNNKWVVETSNFQYPNSTYSGIGRVKFQSGGGTPVKLITPPRDITGYKKPILVFSYASVPFGDGRADSLKVYYRYDANAVWRLAGTYGPTDEYVTVTYDISSPTRTFQVAFEGIDSEGHGVVVDKVMLTGRPTCKTPTNVRFTNVIHNHVKMNWNGDMTTEYIVKVSEDELVNPDEDQALRVDTVFYQTTHKIDTLSGNTVLKPNTTYHYYIRSDCGYGDISEWASGTFTTACDPVASLRTSFDDPADFDCWVALGKTAGAQEVTLPSTTTTWTVSGSGYATDKKPDPRTGASALMFNPITQGLDNHTELWAVSPRLADTIDLREKELVFWMKSSSNFVNVRVMVTDWPDDFSNAEAAGIVKFKSLGNYERMSITFDSLKTTGRYIVFYINGSELTNSQPQFPQVFIDDLELKTFEACNEGTRVSMFSDPVVKETQATLKWNPAGAEKWHVKVSAVSFNPGQEPGGVKDTIVTSPEVLFTGLNPGTYFYYYVRPICYDGTEGTWSYEQAFQTQCPSAGFAVPYKENFDKYVSGTYPPCWTYKILGGTGVPSITESAYSASSPNCLAVYNYNQTVYMVSPKIAGDLSEMQVRFKLSIESTQIPMEIGVMTNPFDDSTFESIRKVYVDASSVYNNYNWKDITVLLSDYSGQGKYVAFKVTINGSHRIDDFVVEPISGCPTPENVEIAHVSTETITLDWTPIGGEAGWDIAWGLNNFIFTGNVSEHTTALPPYTIQGLDKNTTYDVYIRSTCKENGSWYGPLTAKTQSPVKPPYICDFENQEESNAWVFANGTQLNKWIVGSAAAYNTGGKGLYISDSYGSTNTFSAADSYSYAYRALELTPGLYDFEFDWNSKGYGTVMEEGCIRYEYQGWWQVCVEYGLVPTAVHHQHLNVFLVPADVKIEPGKDYGMFEGLSYTTPKTPAGWIRLNDQILRGTDATWQDFIKTYQLRKGGNYNLVFMWKTANSASNQALASAIDNVSVKANTTTCLPPEDVVISKITQSTAQLSFLSYNAEEWTLKVSKKKLETLEEINNAHLDSTWLVFSESIRSNPFTIPGLFPDVTYYAYLKTNCDSDTENNWVSVSFKTICGAVDVPLREDFNAYRTGEFPVCWRQLISGSGTGAAKIDTLPQGTNLSHSLSLYAYDMNNTRSYSFFMTPELSTDIKALQVKLKVMNRYNSSSNPYSLEVGVITDPSDESTFEVIDVITPKVAMQWKNYPVLFDEYTGTGKHIAFRMPTSTRFSPQLSIDDIEIDSIKGCVSPKSVEVTNITPTRADINWRTVGEVGSYRVKVCSKPQTRWGDAGDKFDEVVIGSTSVTVSNLLPSTTYYVYVRTNCGNGEYSFAYSEAEFRTSCGTEMALPFYDNFDSYELGASPDCWALVQNPLSGGIKVQYFNQTNENSGTIYKSIGKASLLINASTILDAMVALPDFGVDVRKLKLNFKALQPGVSSGLIVGVISDITNPNTFVPLDTVTNTTLYAWHDKEVSFENYTGKARHIAFCTKRGVMFGDAFYLDEFYVKNADVTCPDITAMVANQVTDSTAMITWRADENVASFEIKVANYKINPETTEGNVKPKTSVYDEYYELGKLEPSTKYFVYVRNVCDGNKAGYWSDPLEFVTLCKNAITLPYTEEFDGFGEIEDFGYFPDCWRNRVRIQGEISPADQPTPYVEIEENSLMMKAYFDARDNSYAVVDVISPELDFQGGISEYQMTFKMRSTLTNGKLYVGVFTDASDASSFVPYDTVSVTTVNKWSNFLVNFLHYPGQAQHIGFRINSQTAGQTYSVQIDSIVVRELDNCMPPYKARVDARPAKAFVTWLPGDENHSEWEYYYSSVNLSKYVPFKEMTFDSIVTANRYGQFGKGITTQPKANLNGLVNYTLYVYIKSKDCGRFYPYELKYAKPNCQNIELPYTETFSNYGFGAADTTYSAFPDCWTRRDENDGNIAYPYIESDTTLYFLSEAGKTTSATLPQLATTYDITKQRIRFTAMSETNGVIEIGLIHDYSDLTWADHSDYEVVQLIQLTPEFAEYIVEFGGYDTSTPGYSHKYFVALTSPSATTENKVKVKELTLEETPYCNMPEIVLDELTKSSFEISWAKEEGQGHYVMAYGPRGSHIADLTTSVSQDPVYAKTQLTPNTDYDIFVQTWCDNSLRSVWHIFPITTLQEVAQYPYATDFTGDEASNWTLRNGNADNKWVVGSAAGQSDALYVSNDNGTSHAYTVTEPASIFAYRTIDIPAGPQVLSFDWKAGGEAGKDFLRVFLVPQSVILATDKYNRIAPDSVPEGWIAVSGELSGKTDWTKATYDVYISHEIKEPLNLVFYWSDNERFGDGVPAAIDNVKFEESNICTTPEVLTARQVTSTEASLNWISYNADSWYLKAFNTPQDDPETGVAELLSVTKLPYSFTGLTPDQDYYFYVQSQCDDKWSDAGYFRTACAPVNTLLEVFDQVPPPCWNLYEGLASEVFENPSKLISTNTGWSLDNINIGNWEGSHAKLNIRGSNTAHWLVSPAITLTKNSALSFDLSLTAVGNNAPIANPTGQLDDQFMVLVSADEGANWHEVNATVWNNVDGYAFNNISNTGERVDVDLFAYTGEIVRIAFYGESTVELESNDIHIDSARIDCRYKKNVQGDICEGYRYIAHGFDISKEMNATQGTYTYTRVAPSTTGDCDTTYVLTLTVGANVITPRYVTICSNESYSDADFTNKTEAGEYDSSRKEAANGCDSIVRLILTVNQAYEYDRTLEISSADQLPLDYYCKNFPEGTKSGYYEINCKTALGCDSIINLKLVVDGIEPEPKPNSLDEISYESLSFIPNPATGGERVEINYEFTPAEMDGLVVEIFNGLGIKVSTHMPSPYSVSFEAPASSGVYLIKVKTGTGKSLFGKVIVN